MVKVKTAILTLIFLATLLVLIAATPWGSEEKGSYSFEPREGARAPESGIGEVGVEIFTVYLFPFEVLSLVLLAALIGAIYVARKELPR
ncbi:NADH-quinone oxidoreductase subunit J [Methanocrinis sp.]|uniref:NADH-quinone oxidoreductase subunit J n=1 Tax=Methanocrinis sp. TaxID=3101522 RepID=UPI003D12A2AD